MAGRRAADRAGFFTSRTYSATFRTALQHVIDAAGADGVALPEAGERLLAWAGAPEPGRPGSMKEAMAALLPPDLGAYPGYLAFRDAPASEAPPGKLLREITGRLTWQATSEVSLRQPYGRTLERNASATVGWNEDLVAATLEAVTARLETVDPRLVGFPRRGTDDVLPEKCLRLWLYGFLHRHRLRGALEHEYLVPFARHRFWGKAPFSRTIPGREIYPPAGRPQLEEVVVIDLLRCLLEQGTHEGLLVRLHRDATKSWYAIAARAVQLRSDPVRLVCAAQLPCEAVID